MASYLTWLFPGSSSVPVLVSVKATTTEESGQRPPSALIRELEERVKSRYVEEFWYEWPRSAIVKFIRESLDRTEEVRGTENKKREARRLFTWLAHHRYFVWKHDVFAQTIRKKLLQFARYDQFFLRAPYQLLFPGHYLDQDLGVWDGTFEGVGCL